MQWVKCDVSKYFDNIDHEVLKKNLQKIIIDRDVLLLLFKIIDGYSMDLGKSILLGNQSSQWFALYYLDEMDRFIKNQKKS